MVFETISVLIFGIISDFKMKEYFDSQIIQQLVKIYKLNLSQLIDRLGFDPDYLAELKEDILINALNYCYTHKSKFDPTKSNSLAYFATVFKSYIIHEVAKLQKDKKRLIPIQRERRINDLLGIPNSNPTIYNI